MADLVRDTISRQPSPPRRIRSRDVLAAVFRTALTAFVIIFAFVLLLAGLGAVASAKGSLSGVVLAIAGLFVIAAIALLAVPFLYALRITRALRNGLVTEATVTRLARRERPGRRSLEAMRNGFIAGTRIVRHPRGDFEERFEYDGVGAANAREGDKMTVLVTPDRRVVLLTVAIVVTQ